MTSLHSHFHETVVNVIRPASTLASATTTIDLMVTTAKSILQFKHVDPTMSNPVEPITIKLQYQDNNNNWNDLPNSYVFVKEAEHINSVTGAFESPHFRKNAVQDLSDDDVIRLSSYGITTLSFDNLSEIKAKGYRLHITRSSAGTNTLEVVHSYIITAPVLQTNLINR